MDLGRVAIAGYCFEAVRRRTLLSIPGNWGMGLHQCLQTLLKSLGALLLNGLILLLLNTTAQAGILQDRLAQFPDWQSPPSLPVARGDLYYPDWLAGDWQVTSTLLEAVSPLAPAIVTPGFAANQASLQKPTSFAVRFVPEQKNVVFQEAKSPIPMTVAPTHPSGIVADRAYNGRNLATALLGADVVQSIKLDPQSPNRQITVFQDGQRLLTEISARGVERSSPTDFVSSELYQQTFRRSAQIYFNRVENTIAYHRAVGEPNVIHAEQVTAIYLSPQDPDYWQARDRPVALYRYQMQFQPLSPTGD